MTIPAEAADAGARLAELAENARAWPFEEARKLMARRRGDDPVVFETGYGPSGLPHIGTFGEVARTSMVRHAFRVLTEDRVPTRLICFSDDMDGLRKVPDNVPNRDLLTAHLGQPLTRVPDPFGTHDSFGHHNNARLRAFLDAFGFDYEFLSSTDCYASGRFDSVLLRVLERYDEVMAIMLPSLREERQATYSPFLPVCPRTGRVLQVPILDRDLASGTISFDDPDTGERVRVPVTGGHAKLQWKVDWAMRWTALSVDYEMSGKDLSDSVRLSSRICTELGGTPPEGFIYELFLDENGEKISKSRGNGLTIDEWLRYAGPESLSLYMFQGPRKAKRLYFDVIPRHVDDYLSHLARYRDEDAARRLENPVWHIHDGAPPAPEVPIPFSMLLNLASASNSEDRAVLWGFIRRYAPGTSPETHPKLDELVGYAIAYFHDFVLPAKSYRAPGDTERAALEALAAALGELPADADAETIQTLGYDVGREFFPEPRPNGTVGVGRAWFEAFYQVVLGQERGPRFGSFVALYGIAETRALIERALGGELAGG